MAVTDKTPLVKVAAVLVTVLGGVALATQSRVNGQLGARIGDGLFAAVISFSIGLVILFAGVLVLPTARAAAPKFVQALRTHRLRPWQCLGGAGGAFFVTSQGLTVALLGVAMFTVAGVSGQVLSGLLTDRAGFGPGEPRPITPTRATGAVMAVVAVAVAVSDKFDSPSRLWLSLVPALAGLAIGWAQAANGLVRIACGSVAFASFVNFVVGTVLLVVACAIDALVRGLPGHLPPDFLLYTGGALGVVGISTGVFAVRHIGVLMVGLCLITGQVAAAVLFDVTTAGIEPTTVVGVAVTLLAAGVAAVPSGRAARNRPVRG
ncbi:DMT family transporter [Actinokineospora inagensis]|uniref:DMT family transporter n=1 Tax=Actinokineospora inagensis TaxID=103730 RepID=UPI00047A6B5F|nr:DMT family transporter [Actinokineospora inagensis]